MMNKSAVKHHKAHRSPQWRGCRWAIADVPPPDPRHGAAAPEAPGARWPRRRFRLSPPGSLNWSLRRYVPASSLRVWLMRRATGTGRADGMTGRHGSPAPAGGEPGRARTRPPGSSSERADGGSRPPGSTRRYRPSENRQMAHLVQVAAGLRGGVRRGSAITAREGADRDDLILTTLSSSSCV